MRRIALPALALLAVFPVGAGSARLKANSKFGIGVGSLDVSFRASSRVIPIDLQKGVVHRGRSQALDKSQPATFAVALVDLWTPANVARIMEGGGRPTPLTTFVMLDDDCLKRTDIFKDYSGAHFFLAPRGSPLRAMRMHPGDYICEASKCTQDWNYLDFDQKHPPFE